MTRGPSDSPLAEDGARAFSRPAFSGFTHVGTTIRIRPRSDVGTTRRGGRVGGFSWSLRRREARIRSFAALAYSICRLPFIQSYEG